MTGCLQETFAAALDRLGGSQAVATGGERTEVADRAHLERVVTDESGTLS